MRSWSARSESDSWAEILLGKHTWKRAMTHMSMITIDHRDCERSQESHDAMKCNVMYDGMAIIISTHRFMPRSNYLRPHSHLLIHH
jgi:hypothetical protein